MDILLGVFGLNRTAMELSERMGLPCGENILCGPGAPLSEDGLDSCWQNYEAQLAPVQSILEKWAKHHGYD